MPSPPFRQFWQPFLKIHQYKWGYKWGGGGGAEFNPPESDRVPDSLSSTLLNGSAITRCFALGGGVYFQRGSGGIGMGVQLEFRGGGSLRLNEVGGAIKQQIQRSHRAHIYPVSQAYGRRHKTQFIV